MTEPLLNPNLVDTATPPIPEARAWLDAYDGRFGPAINLSQAAPGAPPPQALLDRLGAAAADPEFTRYGPIRGEPALIDAYAGEVGARYRTTISPDQIAITAGCNQAFCVTVLAVAKAGDAVLLPTPWYFNHQMTLTMLGITPLAVPTRAEDGFMPDAEATAALISNHRRSHPRQAIKALVLVSPNNPTGAVASSTAIARLSELVARERMWLVLDETYRDFLPASEVPPHGLLSEPEQRRQLIQLYSFSKAMALPGHRLGAMIVPARIGPDITKVLDCVQICAPRAAQSAVAWALPALAGWRRETTLALVERGRRFQEGMRSAEGWRVVTLGAYFAYVEHSAAMSGAQVARRLASRYGLLVLPGSYFGPGQERYLRFAFANVDDDTAAGVGARLVDIDLQG